MTYTQQDLDNGTVVQIGTLYFLGTDVHKVLLNRVEPVEVDLE